MTVVEQLTEKQTELDAVKAEMQKSVEAVKVATDTLAVTVKERDELKANAQAAEAKHADELKKVQDALTAKEAEHVATVKELETAKQALANPAFAHAAVKGDKKAVAEGSSEASQLMTKEQARAEHDKLSDPVAQACFRRDHAKELGLV